MVNMRISPLGVVTLFSLAKASNFLSFINKDETNLMGTNRTQIIPSTLNHDRWNVQGIGSLFRPDASTTTVPSVNNIMVESIKSPPIFTDKAVVSSPYVNIPLETDVRTALNAPFQPIRINVGGPQLVDTQGRTWTEDRFYKGGNVYTEGRFNVRGTSDSAIFQLERNGIFQYEVPLRMVGSYQVTLHFTELYVTSAGERVFDIHVEGLPFFTNVDIFQRAGGKAWTAVSLVWSQVVSDGALSLSFLEGTPPLNIPGRDGNHAGKDASGPCEDGWPVPRGGLGSVAVPVDGRLSHTHAPNEKLVQYIWQKGSFVVGNGVTATLQLPVGEHTIALTVVDSAGNESTDTTQVAVRSSKYPYIGGISPSKGSVVGNTRVTITGSGFTYTANETVVQFGNIKVAGSMVKIVNANTKQVMSPANVIGAPVVVTVKTPIGVANFVTFTYVASSPIAFSSAPLIPSVKQPSVVAFGPDRRLYIGTTAGTIVRVSFKDGSL
jgi:Malectin domain/IPT/TIG domain